MSQSRIPFVNLIIYLGLIICSTRKVSSLTCHDCVGYVGEVCDANPGSVSTIQYNSHPKSPSSDEIKSNVGSFINKLTANRSSIKKNNFVDSDYACVTLVSTVSGQDKGMIFRSRVPVEQTCLYIKKTLESRGYKAELCEACKTDLCNSNSSGFFK